MRYISLIAHYYFEPVRLWKYWLLEKRRLPLQQDAFGKTLSSTTRYWLLEKPVFADAETKSKLN